MMEIPLTRGLVALIDDGDYETCSTMSWFAIPGRLGTWYAVRSEYDALGCFRLPMHRYIMQPPDDMEIDHIDHNGLNNTRNNMRIVTRREQMINRRRWGTAPYRGLKQVGDRWQARIRNNGELYHLGVFDTAEEAAHAYDAAAKELHGEFATLNFN